jgi:hypothetical protein
MLERIFRRILFRRAINEIRSLPVACVGTYPIIEDYHVL